MVKSYSRKYEASPTFQWLNSAINDANAINVSWETYNTITQKYLPFNSVTIVNNGEDSIFFYPNQNLDNGFLIPKGTIFSLDSTTLPALSSFSIKRAGSTNITASKIIINCSKEGQTPTSIIERLHKRLFS